MRKYIADLAVPIIGVLLMRLSIWATDRTSLYGTYLSGGELAGLLLGGGISFVIFMRSGRRRYWHWALAPIIAAFYVIASTLLTSDRAQTMRELSGNFDLYACVAITAAIVLGAMGGWVMASAVSSNLQR